MPITIQPDSAARAAQRSLADALTRAERASARLASGRRILDAFDDAAGLAIADRAARDLRVSAEALRNTSDGLSAARIASGGLSRTSETLGRLAELAAQAASGTVSDSQRAALQQEFGQLVQEIDRGADTTAFNGQALLGGGPGVSVQVGTEGAADDQVTVPTPDASAAALGLAGQTVATQGGAQAALDAVTAALARVGEAQGQLGAAASRLTAALDATRIAAEQSAAVDARIRDADMAQEASARVRADILAQTSTAMLAQANQSARRVLGLFR